MGEGFLNRVHRIVLGKDICQWGRTKQCVLLTWMSSRSDRQSSVSTKSRCPGALRVDLNLPPKIRVMGLSTALICFFFKFKFK